MKDVPLRVFINGNQPRHHHHHHQQQQQQQQQVSIQALHFKYAAWPMQTCLAA
jgi:hypothetical protein